MKFQGEIRPKQASIEVKIIRANGKVEDLGTVDYYHRSFWMRLWWRITRLFKRTGRFWR